MMTNLFSMFDPSTSYLSMAWVAMLSPMYLITQNKSKMTKKMWMMATTVINKIQKEIKPLMKSNYNKGTEKVLMILFMYILLMNTMALIPFIFTPSAHMLISMPTALSMWLAMQIFGWANNSKKMMAHTVPNGTPLALLNLMVLIEITSNLIRPITLSVRLTANMVAGHLLMSLLSNFFLISKMNMLMSSMMILILCSLEIAVAMIQAYVFMILMTLYTTEIH